MAEHEKTQSLLIPLVIFNYSISRHGSYPDNTGYPVNIRFVGISISCRDIYGFIKISIGGYIFVDIGIS